MDFQNVYKIILASTSSTYSKYVVASNISIAISKIRDHNNFDEVVEAKLEISDVLV